MACEYTLQSRAVLPLTLSLKTDVTKSYIDWAIANDFSVIDVNIPQYVAVENEEVNHSFQLLLVETDRRTVESRLHQSG